MMLLSNNEYILTGVKNSSKILTSVNMRIKDMLTGYQEDSLGRWFRSDLYFKGRFFQCIQYMFFQWGWELLPQ